MVLRLLGGAYTSYSWRVQIRKKLSLITLLPLTKGHVVEDTQLLKVADRESTFYLHVRIQIWK